MYLHLHHTYLKTTGLDMVSAWCLTFSLDITIKKCYFLKNNNDNNIMLYIWKLNLQRIKLA